MTDNQPAKKPAVITDPVTLPEPTRFNKKKIAIVAATATAASAVLIAIGYKLNSCDSDESETAEPVYFYIEPDTTSETPSTEAV